MSQIIVDLANFSTGQGFKIFGSEAYDYSGWSVSSAGDFNGDGYNDTIIGACGGTTSATGTSYLIYGDASNPGTIDLAVMLSNKGFAILGESSGDQSGYSVGAAGDVNRDGYSDIIIGAWAADPSSRSNAGKSYVIYGSASNPGTIDLAVALSSSQGFVIFGGTTNDQSGRSVSTAGDVNGDGYSDIIIAAPNAFSDKGISYVVFGRPNNIVNIDLADLKESQGFSILGAAHSVSSAGDINRDGFDDVIIGSPTQNDNTGISYIIFGVRTDIEINPVKTILPSVKPTHTPTALDSSDLGGTFSPTPLSISPVPIYTTVNIKFGGLYDYADNILGSGNFIIDSPTNAVLTTGSGADMFTIMPHAGVITTITNFDSSCEIIDLSNFAKIHNINDMTITNKNAVIIILPNGEEVRLLNLQSEDVSAGNFIFSPDVHENHNNKNEELSYGAIAGIVTAGVLFTVSAGYMVYAKSFQQWPFGQSFVGLSDSKVETNTY